MRRLGSLGYLGVFAVTLVANATVVVPVPYFGLVARLAQQLDFAGVVLAGALGSALGESVAYFVGRSGRGVVEDTRFYRWVHIQMRHPWRAFGTKTTVEHVRHAIRSTLAAFPKIHTLAIGDLSAEHGGWISDHQSHRSGSAKSQS